MSKTAGYLSLQISPAVTSQGARYLFIILYPKQKKINKLWIKNESDGADDGMRRQRKHGISPYFNHKVMACDQE